MAKLKLWQTLASRYIHRSPFVNLRGDRRWAPGLGEHEFYVLEYPDWVNVVAVTEADQVVLVRQFRHGLNDLNLEIPGGIIDCGEEPVAAAVRELREETGFAAGPIRHLATVSVNPAIQTNWCHLFLATDCRLVGQQALDGTESIAVELVPLTDLSGLVEQGVIHHSLNCLAIHLAISKLAAR